MDQQRRGASVTTAVAVAVSGYLLLQLFGDMRPGGRDAVAGGGRDAAAPAAATAAPAAPWLDGAIAAEGNDATGDVAPLLGPDGSAAAAGLIHGGPPRLQYLFCTS